VNYVLYGLAKTAANVCNSTGNTLPNPCVFNDVTKGNVSVACVGGSANCSNTSTATGQFGAMATASGGTTPAFNAAPGYDRATGLGSINVANLLAKWAPPTLVGTTTTLALTGPATAAIGASVTFTGMVTKSSGTATPTGLVLLEDQTTGVTITSVSLPASGAFTMTTTLLPAAAAPYNVIAHYSGDGTFAASDSTPPISMTVPKQNSQVLVDFITFATNGTPTQNTASATVAYGANYIMRVDVTNTAGTPCQNASAVVTFVCPTGSVQLFQNPGVALNDFPNAQNANATSVARLNDRGFAEDQPIQLAPGSYHISATYTADANSSFNSSTTSNTVAVTVTQATTTTTLKPPSPASIVSGGSVTLTATVTARSNGEPPCGSGVANPGTVQFKNGSTAISGTVSYTGTSGASTGQASCTATLTTTLSQFVPPTQPRTRPQIPVLPVGGIVSVLLIMFLAMQRRLSMSKRLGYAASGLVLLACVAAGFAGCSGSGSGGGGSHTDSITAAYSGDANYAGSTATAVTVAIQ